MQRPRLLITRRLPEAVHERLRNSYDVTANPDDLPSDREALGAHCVNSMRWCRRSPTASTPIS